MIMKKLLTFLLLSIFFLLPINFSLAQSTEKVTDTAEEKIVEKEKGNTADEEEQKGEEEEQKTLADTLERKQIEEIENQTYSFWTILLAILIPSIFIILGYLMLKFLQT